MRWGYDYYESNADKIAKAKSQLEKLRKKDPTISPITIEGRTIAKSWWGKAWTNNLNTYADYSNRIGRGRSYVKNGLVLDLKINTGEVFSYVCGSSSKPYQVNVEIDPLPQQKLVHITELCNKKINSLEELIEGKFPKDLMELFTSTQNGLFPSTQEIDFHCSCPDRAIMCKHVSAVLYAIGAKFDHDPALFFVLRSIDFNMFLAKTVEEKMLSMLKNADRKSKRALDEKYINELFGV